MAEELTQMLSDEMLKELKQFIRVTISEDSMEASLYLSSSPDESGVPRTDLFTVENINRCLAEAGVKAGIDKSLIQSVVINRLYDTYHVVAKGLPAVNGKDGAFTFYFKTSVDNRPKILPDGSVDYRNIEIYEPVSEGQLIAEYTPPTTGHFGYNVRGGVLSSIPGKPQNPLTGTGFTISEDKCRYVSDCNGKIEYNSGTITVTNVLDINGDVDISTGDIVFNGDVVIHGNVLAGSLIKINGSLKVLGNVESAYVCVGGDIEFKSGMQGGGKGVVECGGEVWGKFFEQTTMRVKGTIHANSLLNCDVFGDGDIFVTGRHGIIVGGNTACAGSVEATAIGNMAEVRTLVCAGVTEKLMAEINELEKTLADIEEKEKKHNQVLEKLTAITNPTDIEKYDTMLDQVNTSLKELHIRHVSIKRELDQKLFLISSYSNSRIKVAKYLYPNVALVINGIKYFTKDTFVNVTIANHDGKIEVINEVG